VQLNAVAVKASARGVRAANAGGTANRGGRIKNPRPSFGGLTANRLMKRYVIAGTVLAGIKSLL
jgi:hypothetical protein